MGRSRLGRWDNRLVPIDVIVPVEQLWHRIPGGTARATRETLIALRGVETIQTRGLAAWHRPARRAVAAAIGDVTYVPLPRRLLYEGWLRLGQPSVERMGGGGDVVWAASMIPPPSRLPMVATVHDLGFLDHPERSTRRGRAFFPRIWSAVRERAAVIVCPSQVVVEDCVRHGVEPSRLRVVPWGVAPPISSPERVREVRASLRLPERYVLWVGTLEPRKNLPRLVEAMEKVPGVPLVVVGPTGWNLDGSDVLAPLGGRAHRLGAVDEMTLSSLYAAASVFAFPSLVEGFGLPVLEALAHGTPVVTSAGTATAEVADGAARLVDPTDPSAIASGIEAALERDAVTLDLVERGRRRASELSWSAVARRYTAVFEEVVR